MMNYEMMKLQPNFIFLFIEWEHSVISKIQMKIDSRYLEMRRDSHLEQAENCKSTKESKTGNKNCKERKRVAVICNFAYWTGSNQNVKKGQVLVGM